MRATNLEILAWVRQQAKPVCPTVLDVGENEAISRAMEMDSLLAIDEQKARCLRSLKA